MSAHELELFHYTAKPLTFDRSRTYEQRPLSTYAKPVGFWVSVAGEDDWPTWCAREDFDLWRLRHPHAIKLNGHANVLTLTSVSDLSAFADRYGVRKPQSYPGVYWIEVSIAWANVAAEYDGIIVAPYQWSRQDGLDWYNGWDCASGCIWNLDAIADVKQVATDQVVPL